MPQPLEVWALHLSIGVTVPPPRIRLYVLKRIILQRKIKRVHVAQTLGKISSSQYTCMRDQMLSKYTLGLIKINRFKKEK